MRLLSDLFPNPLKQKRKYGFQRVRVEWNRVSKEWVDVGETPSYSKTKKKIVKEHGYGFPEPNWVWRELSIPGKSGLELDSIFSDSIQQNIQLELTREAKQLGLSTATEDFWTAYFFYTPTFVEVSNTPAKDVEEIAKTRYLYHWYHAGGQPKESSVDVGLASCTLQIFLKPARFLFTWWERETGILTPQDVNEWGDALQKELEQVMEQWSKESHGNQTYFQRFLVKFFLQAHQFTQMARASAKDPSLHFYQDPRWEQVYARQEGLEWVKKYYSKNRHPDSLKWVKDE